MSAELLGPLSSVRSQTDIDPVQARQLEAIGFGLDTVDAIYRRLVDNLAAGPRDLLLAFADAWAIIDWVHRLDGLVRGCRGMPGAADGVTEFLNASCLVENLRHLFQHPENELRAAPGSRRSLWGHLGWQHSTGIGIWEVVQITPFGRFSEPDIRQPADFDQPPRAQIDRVSLFSPDEAVEIGLTGQHAAVTRFARRLDAAVQVARHPETGGILKLTVWLPDPGPAASGASV
jgi:hypothetical protein